MVVFGTRPEAIKMCPLIMELKKRKGICVVTVVTGQHREMLDSVLRFFNIQPEYDFSIMKEKQTLFNITNSVLVEMEKVINVEAPDIVLVHGDTTTSFSAALAAYYCHVPVGHVEAGLRTYHINSPYPEEFNRQAISIVSKYNFAPTRNAADNLIREGKERTSIFVTGNTVIDAMAYTVKDEYCHKELDWARGSKLILLTAHRRENIGSPMHKMFRAIRRIVEEDDEIKVIYPIHMNPEIRRIANEELGCCDRIHIIEPLDVLDCHNFEAKCYFCLTDSGGIQEECASLGKPVLVMRKTTERPEGIAAGGLRLVGIDEQSIYEEVKALVENEDIYKNMSNLKNPFGDGMACVRIADVLEKGSCREYEYME